MHGGAAETRIVMSGVQNDSVHLARNLWPSVCLINDCVHCIERSLKDSPIPLLTTSTISASSAHMSQ